MTIVLDNKELQEARRVGIPDSIIGKMAQGIEPNTWERDMINGRGKEYVSAHKRDGKWIKPHLRNYDNTKDVVKLVKNLPKEGEKLGVIDNIHLYNINGKVHTFAYSRIAKGYITSDQHIGRGHMLKELGIEFNVGGGLFVPHRYTEATGRKTFRGMTKKEIKDAQKKY